LMKIHQDMERMYSDVLGTNHPQQHRYSLEGGQSRHNSDDNETEQNNPTQRQLATANSGSRGILNSFRGFGDLQDWRPRWDIKDVDNKIEVLCELPGVSKDDVKVEINNNVLTVSGKRDMQKEEKNDHFYVRERSTGSFSRSVRLPDGVKQEDLKAKFDNGMLKVCVTKPQESQRQQIAIE